MFGLNKLKCLGFFCVLCLLVALFVLPVGADRIGLLVSEVDGTPGDVYAYKIIMPNGTVSITGGVATYTAAAGAGSGDVTAVGNCATGACLDGTSDGGTQVLFYDAQGATTLAVGDNAGAVALTLPNTTGTLTTAAEQAAAYQPLEATLTDIADGTITENLVNTANPWADNEVADDITLTDITQITNRAITSLSATNWRLFYSADGAVPVELALGASGTYLKSNGAAAAPTFDTPGGSGDVTAVGNCADGECLDGTSDGGTQILFYDAQGATTLVGGDTAGAVTITLPIATGTLLNADGTGASLTAVDAVTGDSATDFFDAGEIVDARISDTLTIGAGSTIGAVASGTMTGYPTGAQPLATALTSLAGLTETNGGIAYGTADNAYAWLGAGAEGTLLMGNGAGAPSFLAAGTSGYMLVAAGAADPVWTLNTGTGAPMRGTSPTVTTSMLMTNASDLRVSTTTDAHEFSIQVYDNDDTTWRDALTFTNGNSPSVTLGASVTLGGLGVISVGDDIVIADTKSIRSGAAASDYFSIETTDDVGGTPAQVEAMRVTVGGTSAAPLVEIGDSGATSPSVVNYIQAGADAQADTKYSGTVITGLNAGETIAAFDLVYFDGTENEWMIADADASGKFPARGIALAAGSNGNPLDVLTQGVIRNDTVFSWTANGATLYLDDVAGDAIEVAGIPATANDCIQVVGWSITDDEAYFNFDGHWNLVE